MHYSYVLIVEPTNTVSSPAYVEMKLHAGIIRRVQIQFPRGPNFTVRCIITNGVVQLLPTNPDGYYRGDNIVIDAPCWFDTDEVGNTLYAVGWAVGARYRHTLTIMIDVIDREELDTLYAARHLNNAVSALVEYLRDAFY